MTEQITIIEKRGSVVFIGERIKFDEYGEISYKEEGHYDIYCLRKLAKDGVLVVDPLDILKTTTDK